MTISPLPRRYFRLSFVLSLRSSFQHGGVCSSTTAQYTFSRNSSISGSCRVISTPRVWAQELGCLALGLSSPLPCPQTARPSGCKGARNAREPATNPCSATGASGIHPPLLGFSRESGQSPREREIRPRRRDDRRAK